MSENKNKKKIKKRIIIIAVFLAVLTIVIIIGNIMKVEKYELSSKKLKDDVRIVFLSDLHNCFYGGTDQSGLKKEIEKAAPDIVIFGGDVIDGWGGTKHSLTIMKWAAEKYPCFYTPGNHEEMRDDMNEFISDVKALGINVCERSFFDVNIKDQPIRIYGIINSFEAFTGKPSDDPFKNLDNGCYNILIAHQPEQIDQLLDTGNVKFDLILSGHAHAGQWRIPGILDQGLYAPDQGIFPDYTNGQFEYDSTTHIISRGLAKPMRMIFIPRIFNNPEFSVIDIRADK